jgi:hypothetical protein
MWLGDDVWDESIQNAAVAWSACRGVRRGVIGCHRGDQSRTAVTTVGPVQAFVAIARTTSSWDALGEGHLSANQQPKRSGGNLRS